jgi:hypothetical protein
MASDALLDFAPDGAKSCENRSRNAGIGISGGVGNTPPPNGISDTILEQLRSRLLERRERV